MDSALPDIYRAVSDAVPDSRADFNFAFKGTEKVEQVIAVNAQLYFATGRNGSTRYVSISVFGHYFHLALFTYQPDKSGGGFRH